MRSGWMRMVRTAAAMLALVGGVWASGAGAAEIKNVTVKYAWPWGAFIDYEVVGTLGANDPLIVEVIDRTKNVTYVAASNALSGDTGRNAGAHRLIWDLDKQGVKIDSTNVVFSVEYRGAYCVVDLSAGSNATSYPVTFLTEPPSGGFNTDEYKTTKLALRRIEPGNFLMGGTYHTTISKPFFIGVFEVTQKQWTLVMGNNPTEDVRGDRYPMNNQSYSAIRGSSAGSNWPTSNAVDASSFMGRLRAKTGLEFDLPTEAQWEYACRAGTTSLYNNGGNSTNDLKQLGYYYSSAWDTWCAKPVGGYKPNAWGLYDMHGNVWEQCLDWYGNLTGGRDPQGPSTGTNRVVRGGAGGCEAGACTSSSRRPFINVHYSTYGFRLARTVSEKER